MALVHLPVGVRGFKFVRYVPAAAETCVCTCAGRVRGSAPVRLADTLPGLVDARRVGRLVTRPQGGAGLRQAPARGLRSSRFTSQSAMSSAASW